MNSFEIDYEKRLNPELMTRLLSNAVPSVKDTGFRYLEVKNGYCRSLLPLNYKSSNQHGTHQALLLAMGGDYTGGLALASLIRLEPILGIHEITPDKGMSLWLTGSEMKYLFPSTEDVYIESVIDESNESILNMRYHNGQTILKDVEITFKTLNDQMVARGKFRYYLKKKTALNLNKSGQKMNIMFEHILKTSAKLVAELRANEMKKPEPLFIDEYSGRAAGKQGSVIGERFMEVLPELQNMIAARTYYLDSIINSKSDEIKQVVFLGAGFDFRTLRLQDKLQGTHVFELDLPEMISEKEKILTNWKINSGAKTTRIACNFLTESIHEALITNGFDPKEPSLFIYEGCSMYFSEEENNKILIQVSKMLEKSKAGYLWLDAINSSVINNLSLPDSVKGFLSKIAVMGEPFIYGIDPDKHLFTDNRLKVAEFKKTSNFIGNCENEIYDLYSFYLLKHQNAFKQSIMFDQDSFPINQNKKTELEYIG